MEASGSGYQIVSDAAESERLRRQGELLAPATRMLLEAAGIGPGMRILDLGSGMGDVTFLPAGPFLLAGSVPPPCSSGWRRSWPATARSSPTRSW